MTGSGDLVLLLLVSGQDRYNDPLHHSDHNQSKHLGAKNRFYEVHPVVVFLPQFNLVASVPVPTRKLTRFEANSSDRVTSQVIFVEIYAIKKIFLASFTSKL